MTAASLPVRGVAMSKILLLVNPFLWDEVLESIGMRGEPEALLRTKTQEPLADKRIAEQLDGSILQGVVEIDQYVPARDQVHLPEYGIGDQAMVGKDHSLPQRTIERGLPVGCGV